MWGNTVRHKRVLVLNRGFYPVNVIGARRAFCMLYLGVAEALDEEFNLFDFRSWSLLLLKESDDFLGTSRGRLRMPRVLVLKAYNRVPRGYVRFTRTNIFIRDGYCCQYCHKRFARSDLNLDHVMPRSRNGTHSWSNVVTSCIRCNSKKGCRTPKEANMPLLRKPKEPNWQGGGQIMGIAVSHAEWRPFLIALSTY
ncbi:MAG: HNH endonuclease [Myxococcota bacterium]|nr:HNH endonuclease [Myxococcota bacterium]